jgi:prepilin-type N-terminal cleavage/methylation domain-containing protein/prepilin-type processing-associated H-X9-DG protein
MSSRFSLRRAFTLVELLVVVAVIAIIVAVLFPMFAKERHYPKKSSCQNNLKQIALGFKQYLNDNNDFYPLFRVTDVGGITYPPPYGWADAIQPYIKNTQAMQCIGDSTNSNGDSSGPGFTDYWYNANFMVKNGRLWRGANESALGSSAQTILAGEGGNESGTPTGDARYNQCGDGKSLTNFGQRCTVSAPGLASFPAAQLHLDGANFAFADGHVKWLKGATPTQSARVSNNGSTQKSVGGNFTFSLLRN